MKAAQILIIEDDEILRELTKEYLAVYGHEVDMIGRLEDYWAMAENKSYDLILLDLNLPDGDGLVLLERLRKISDVPVFIISGRDDDASRLRGLELGADDYLIKPFNARELELRVKNALSRRLKPISQSFAGWTLKPTSLMVEHQDGNKISLTLAEHSLLKILLEAQGEVVERDDLLDQLSILARVNCSETLNALIYRLRKKLGFAKDNNPIVTLQGVGYYLIPE